MITANEKKILRFLLANFNKDYSINEIAKHCDLAPNGAYETLKKFEVRGVLLFKKIANSKSYKINFENKEARKLLEIILIPDYQESKISYRYNDLKPLEEITQLGIIFGSYLTKKEPNDLDILFVIKKADYKKYHPVLDKVKIVIPFKVHDVIQTKEDFKKNLQKRNKLTTKVLSEGAILWGQEFLVEVIKNAQKDTFWRTQNHQGDF